MYLCDICKDDGRCKNNEKSNDYDDFYSDYWDCIEYIEKTENRKVGSTMRDWIVNIKQDKEDYISPFCKWSSKHK